MSASKSIFKATALAALVTIVVFGGGAYILYNLNTLAKPVTERIASNTLGVSVKIGAMDIALQEKTVRVSNIRIANPAGYKKPHAVTIDNVQVSLGDIAQDFIEFRAIEVSGAQTYLEVKSSGTNLQALKQGMAQKQEKRSALRVIIDRLSITKTQLQPSVTLLSAQDLKAVRVPDLTLRGIGRKENGILVNDALRQVMTPFLKSVSKAAGSAGFYDGLSTEALKEIGTGQVNAIKDEINREVDKVTNGLKGLFE